MFESKMFMYQKPDEIPKEKRLLVLNEDDRSVSGIDLNRLTAEERIELDNAVNVIIKHVKEKYRKYLKERMIP